MKGGAIGGKRGRLLKRGKGSRLLSATLGHETQQVVRHGVAGIADEQGLEFGFYRLDFAGIQAIQQALQQWTHARSDPAGKLPAVSDASTQA